MAKKTRENHGRGLKLQDKNKTRTCASYKGLTTESMVFKKVCTYLV